MRFRILFTISLVVYWWLNELMFTLLSLSAAFIATAVGFSSLSLSLMVNMAVAVPFATWRMSKEAEDIKQRLATVNSSAK